MQKIPVGATISKAYGFGFGNVLSVLGVLWFPHVVLAAIVAAIVYGLAPDLPGQFMHGEFDLAFFRNVIRIIGIVWLASIVIRSMVTVGLQERALGRSTRPVFFYFSLGAPVWRLIGAFFLAFLVMLFVIVLTVGAVVAISLAANKFVPHGGKAIIVIAAIAGAAWYIYAVVRLTFFLPAVVVAEEKIGLVRAWELAGGNFWRIVAVAFVVFVPVAIGFQIVSSALIGPFVISTDFASHFASHFGPHFSADDVAKAYGEILTAVFKQLRGAWLIVLAIDIVQTLIYHGLGNGMIANAYLGVTQTENVPEGAA